MGFIVRINQALLFFGALIPGVRFRGLSGENPALLKSGLLISGVKVSGFLVGKKRF